MFNAPGIIKGIPDIAAIYKANEKQGDALREAVSRMDDNIFFEDMHSEQIERWEKILKISPVHGDTWNERRFRVRTKVLERPPYSYRVIKNKIEVLCPGGCEIAISNDRQHVYVLLALRSEKMLTYAKDLVEQILPLNMTFDVIALYNRYSAYNRKWTHGQLASYTHKQLREDVIP